MRSIATAAAAILILVEPAAAAPQAAGPNPWPPEASASPSGPFASPGPTHAAPVSRKAPGMRPRSLGTEAGRRPPAGLHRGAVFPERPSRGTGHRPAAGEVRAAAYEPPPPSGNHAPAPGATGPAARRGDPEMPLSQTKRRPGLALSPPAGADSGKPAQKNGLPSLLTVGGSLALVLGIFFLVAWAMRQASPTGGAMLPTEVFEVLGRAPAANRGQLHLLRCGHKLILVSFTQAGAETLTEITDPAEVDRLAGLCRQAHPHSATAAFREVFGQLASSRRAKGSFRADPLDDPRSPAAAARIVPGGSEERDA